MLETYAKHSIPVNTVGPALFASRMTDTVMEKRAKEKGTSFDEAIERSLKEEHPTLDLKRRGEVNEVAAAMLLLCSRQAGFMTGINLRIDSGAVATV